MDLIKKIVLISLFAAPFCQAMFMQPDIESVPVERLAQNIQNKLKKDPKNPEQLFMLARIYSMAYAKKSAELEVRKGKGSLWLGFVPRGIPYKVTEAKGNAEKKVAASYLKKAIELHKQVVAIKPDNYLARLGLAWCTQQAGDKHAAITLYRSLITDSLPADRKMTDRYHGLPTISTEASNYLIELLDPKTDAEEIATLKKQSAETEKRIPRMITPIAIALNGAPSADDFIADNSSVRFDLDGSGVARNWQWINRDTAWLVYDPKGSGTITSALQMFGNVTFWLFWENGYDAMAALDDNGDGSLSEGELTYLSLWHDANQNGISETGEVKPLADHGIIRIDCASELTESGMLYNPSGVTLKDGTTKPTCDVILKRITP